MSTEADLTVLEMVQRHRDRVEIQLQDLRVKLAELVGTYEDKGSIPVAEIKALDPGIWGEE